MRERILCLVFMIAAVGTSLQLSAQNRQYLHEGWTFGEARLPNRYPAIVPGVVHTDLMHQGLIDDPYVGLNERKVQWVDKEDWIYETTFQTTASLIENERVELCFDGLDTYADVYLNETKILGADNMFRRWRVDVKQLLKTGENVLRVYFHSPIKVDMPKWEQHPHLYGAANDQSENGGVLDRKLSVFARKAGYHYGWDWGPRLVASGIWRDVYLEAWSDVRISNTHLRQQQVSKRLASLSNVVEVEATRDITNAVITVTDESTGRKLAKRKCTLRQGLNTIPVDFSIKNPRLWWCNGLGNPELYTLSTQVSVGRKMIAKEKTRVGLRSVELVTEPDASGKHQSTSN